MFQTIKTATILFGLLTAITGVAYPLAITVVAQVAFPHAANGSLFVNSAAPPKQPSSNNSRDWRADDGPKPGWAGSELVGQPFTEPQYFWSRPSSTAPVAYQGLGGSGSNQAPSNPALLEAVRDRIAKLREADPDNAAKIPVDLVTASASGLDPHISEAAAIYQAARVARVRSLDEYTVTKLVLKHCERPTFGILGQTRVNVNRLNQELDAISSEAPMKNAGTVNEGASTGNPHE